MAHIARFAPKTPKNHEQLAVVRRPLFRPEGIEPPADAAYKNLRSKSRLNSEYISRVRHKVEQVHQVYENWPWRAESPLKGIFSKRKAATGLPTGSRLLAAPLPPENLVSNTNPHRALVASTSSMTRVSNVGANAVGRIPDWFKAY